VVDTATGHNAQNYSPANSCWMTGKPEVNCCYQAIPLVDYIVTETGRLRGKTSLADAHSCKSLSLRGSR
jgi:hypothetical protein